MSTGLLALIVVIASLSPLCTLAALWQVKEWRTDRLREHLRSEGILRQLFGVTRPALLALTGIPYIVGVLPEHLWPLTPLLLFIAANALQIVLKKQREPVWTQKAIALCMTSTLLIAVAALETSPRHLPFLPLLVPAFLLIAWMLWQPADALLKRRVMRRARAVRSQRNDLRVIGITGSVGKSTTKELLAHILGKEKTLATPAHVNTEMGVSQWLSQMLPAHQNIDTLIVEMGAYRPGEIALLCSIVQPQFGILTFIGTQHIGLFGSQEVLSQAKGELLAALPPEGHAFLNGDCSLCASLKDKAPCPVVLVGTGGPVDIEAFEIEETPQGIRFRVGTTRYSVPLHGTHNVTNVLLAIAVARALEMKDEEIAAKLSSFSPMLHTFSVREERETTILDDTHNASPASFQAALGWARGQPAAHKILLTSGMIELGEAQDRIHEELGEQAASIVERVIFLNRTTSQAFARGYGNPVEIFRAGETARIPEKSLLLCVGRMKETVIESLIP
ncbi:hypothetical protein COU80_03240 [Candidatus Peregrinibacteria bacterium CG10_big_fil_rev_8_21_14_0_10_55_24]|nr:MAG: hypothetical protein COU80_03240 [Candidatus Peregrinibacteria bacterium CG10_big_fil_rev_8_21_14_0_10_55_24]